MNPHYEVVAARAQHRCEYCRAPEAVFNFPFEVEHIVPLVAGGVDVEWNLALACRSCNVRKGVRVEQVDPVSNTIARLYHPREDSWSEHFAIDIDTGAVTGRTAVGRATVAQLRMNSSAQLAARRLWIRLGLFP
jgi:hypothetical protein